MLDAASERKAEKTAAPAHSVSGARVADIERAIERVTRALGAADDAEIPVLVAERAAMRAELRALLETGAGNVVPIRGRT